MKVCAGFTACSSMILVALLLLVAVTPGAWGQMGPPATVTVEVTPMTSTPYGIPPSTPGMSPGNRIYLYDPIAAGTGISDNIPVRLCITGSSGTWNSFTLEFAPDGMAGNLPGVTNPADVTFSSSEVTGLPFCKQVTIVLNTGALSDIDPDVDYTKNILVREKSGTADPSSRFNVTVREGDHIKIRVRVATPNGPTCFATDSDFNFLLDCSGAEVKSGDSGRFAIVANKKNVEVATNPGQFYYNLLWKNTSTSPKTVTVTFSRSGVNPKGAQAIHASLFAPPFDIYDDVTQANFNGVNDDIPSASDDVLESVVVPAGYTLWVTYHLEWSGLGGAAPGGIALTCAGANQTWNVTATLSGDASGSCTAGATGYKK